MKATIYEIQEVEKSIHEFASYVAHVSDESEIETFYEEDVDKVFDVINPTKFPVEIDIPEDVTAEGVTDYLLDEINQMLYKENVLFVRAIALDYELI